MKTENGQTRLNTHSTQHKGKKRVRGARAHPSPDSHMCYSSAHLPESLRSLPPASGCSNALQPTGLRISLWPSLHVEPPDSSKAALSWVKRRQIVYCKEFFGQLINNKVEAPGRALAHQRFSAASKFRGA